MSNRVYFESTKFEDLAGNPTWGYRLYDDYGQNYDNNFDELEMRNWSAQDALNIIKESSNEDIIEMASFITKEKLAFFFNDEYVELNTDGSIKEKDNA